MQTITRADFDAVAAGDPYYNGRWPFVAAAREVISTLPAVPAQRVLEVGPYRLAVVPGCETMDILPKLEPTYLHNARQMPWPMADGAYELVVGLQVFEHLGPRDSGNQERAFAEITRVASRAVLSFPYKWAGGEDNWHAGIDLDVIRRWALGQRPDRTIRAGVLDRRAGTRIICIWDRLGASRPVTDNRAEGR